MLLYWAVAQKWPAQEIYISCTQLVGGCALDMAACILCHIKMTRTRLLLLLKETV